MKSLFLIIACSLLVVTSFGKSAYKVDGNNVLIDLDGIGVKSNHIKIEVWTPSVIKVISTMNDDYSEKPDLFGKRSPEPVKFKVAYAQSNIEIATENIIVNVAEDGMIRVLNHKGRKILVESNRTYKENGDGTYHVTQKFFLNRGEHTFGFGQQDLNTDYILRNREFDLSQSSSDISSPIMFSERGYAFIWDNYSATSFKDIPSGMTITSDIAEDIEFFIVNGPDWNHIISEIIAITGESQMLPKWAYGYHLHRAGYESDDALAAAVEKYQSMGIPVENEFIDNSLCKKEQELTVAMSDDHFKIASSYVNMKEEYANIKKQAGDKRIITPTHSNFPGIQQYGTYTKAGAISSCWKSLESQVQAGITSGFTGQPYWSTTIGGMKENPDCPVENMDELMTRWFQFAALTPIFQGSPNGYEAWDNSTKGIENAIKLRYQMMPYIYTSAYQASTQKKNILNSLLFDFREDEATHTVANQYLFGSSIMVCPVTENSATTVPVYFPAGINWVDFNSNKTMEGGSKANVPVTMENIPMFVKQGSILPLSVEGDSIMEIRVYAGADANFVLFEDEGDGFGYKAEKFSTIEFKYTEKNKTVQIGSIEGEFPEMISERTFHVVRIDTDGETSEQTVDYEGKKAKVKF